SNQTCNRTFNQDSEQRTDRCSDTSAQKRTSDNRRRDRIHFQSFCLFHEPGTAVEAEYKDTACIFYSSLFAICCCIPSEFIFQIPDIGVFIDINRLNTHCIRPVSHLFRGNVIGECRVVRSSTEDPCLCAGLQIWFRCPERGCNRKSRHRFFRFFTIDIVDNQAESVSKINERSCNRRTFLCR